MSLPQAIRAVILGTTAAGIVGGIFGVLLGKAAPGFFAGLAGTDAGGTDPVETGLALGAIAGLVLGATGCVVLAAVKMWAETRAKPEKVLEYQE